MDSEGKSFAKNENDGPIAIFILFVVLTGVVVGGLYLYRNGQFGKKQRRSVLQIPPAREAYIKGKERLDPSLPTELDELKKLLMHRAISTIPMIIQLQSDGNSIDSLYKKGMLTDDMHAGVKEVKTYVDQEYSDIQNEADALVDDWGQQIWPSAMQFYQVLMRKGQEEAEKEMKEEEEKKQEKKREKKEKSKKIKEEMQLTSSTSSGSLSGASEPAEKVSAAPAPALSDDEMARIKADKIAQELMEEEDRSNQKKSPKDKKKSKKNN